MKFSQEGFLQQMRPNPQFPADLAAFAEEILDEKLYFLCSASCVKQLKHVSVTEVLLILHGI